MAELGAGGGSGYPGALDTDATPEVDNVTDARADVPNDLADAIVKIETELGVDPAGASADLVTRLEAVDTLLGSVTAAEFSQLETLDAITVSTTQWGALGALVEWTDWTPTLTDAADLSGYNSARYFRLGDICFFVFSALDKNVTSAGAIEITLPFTVATTANSVPGYRLNDGTSGVSTVVLILNNNNRFVVWKTITSGTWAGTETGVEIFVSGFFEIA